MSTEAERPGDGIRAFVAIRLGDRVEREVVGFIDEIALRIPEVRWIARSKLHVTLRFLGDRVRPDRIVKVAEAIGAMAADFAPFAIDVRGSGAFPHLKRPRVLWIGVASAPLVELGNRVEDAIVSAGFEREARAFSPHLTIGRIRPPARLTAEAVEMMERAADREFGRSNIQEVLLYRSILARDGSAYQQLGRFPLRAPSDNR